MSSGCDRLLNHGRTADTVAEDTGSEAKPPLPSDTSALPEPSNTPAPTPEPQPSSGSVVSSDLISWHWYFPTINVSNSVAYWVLNSVGYAVALALVIVVYDVFRFFKPEIIEIPAPKPADSIVLPAQFEQSGYQYCFRDFEQSFSYTWYFAKRETKRYFYVDKEKRKIDTEIPVYQLCNSRRTEYLYKFYVYKPAPSQ